MAEKYDYEHVLALLEVVEGTNPNSYPSLKPIHDQAMLELNDIVNPPTEEELKARADKEKALEDKKAADLKAKADAKAAKAEEEERVKAQEAAAAAEAAKVPNIAESKVLRAEPQNGRRV